MISEKDLAVIRANFMTASREFDFAFKSPFLLTDTIAVFGYIENYGSEKGTVVCLTEPPEFHTNHDIREWCERNGFFCSFLNVQPLLEEYDPSYFREMLRDWGRC